MKSFSFKKTICEIEIWRKKNDSLDHEKRIQGQNNKPKRLFSTKEVGRFFSSKYKRRLTKDAINPDQCAWNFFFFLVLFSWQVIISFKVLSLLTTPSKKVANYQSYFQFCLILRKWSKLLFIRVFVYRIQNRRWPIIISFIYIKNTFKGLATFTECNKVEKV